MLQSPLINTKLLLNFILVAAFTGIGLDYAFDNRLDYWVHDSAVVSQARSQWKHVAVVVMDAKVPVDVARIQSLPLFALAAERLAAAGGKGMFLDARVSKELEGRMPYASCIEQNGDVRWSQPQCSVTSDKQCQVSSSEAGKAPLKMTGQAIARFSMAPFPAGQQDLPDFLLFDFDAAAFISEQGIVALDHLVTRNSPIARWIDLTPGHAVLRLSESVNPDLLQQSMADESQNEICDKGSPCRRIRLSKPLYALQSDADRLFLPLSTLASCDQEAANSTAALVKDKAVIFQVTSPTETTDTVITPMTTALTGPRLLTPGAQYLADAVETMLNHDYPHRPGPVINTLLFFGIAAVSVLAGAYLRPWLLWLVGGLVFFIMAGLCFINPVLQLWPVTAAMAVFAVGALQTTGTRLVIGLREAKLASQYLPEQVHNMLLKLKSDESFKNTCSQVVVLMSDLEGYTTITGILEEPESLLDLMNDYLNETSLMLQDKYHGWLESYVGDMVCYYWPFHENDKEQVYQNALQAVQELAVLQQNFFNSVPLRYADKFAPRVLDQISQTINAGIALTSGRVVMGDLGPKHGVRKFGILGDPLNLVSRVESLTRMFDTEIIVTGDLVDIAKKLDIPARRLGFICVKGRNTPAMLYALGSREDERFTAENIAAWENWLAAVEQRQDFTPPCPAVYRQDRSTLENWLQRGLLTEQGVWHLHEK
ncbi:MAG: adenylate/guanylate cyclase domain-containing protein [Methylobacter sp.]